MKTITLTDDETKILIDLIQDEMINANILRLESEHVLERIGGGNICARVQKKQIKEAEETLDRCNNLLEKFEVKKNETY